MVSPFTKLSRKLRPIVHLVRPFRSAGLIIDVQSAVKYRAGIACLTLRFDQPLTSKLIHCNRMVHP
jgi:hypothetical protein